MLLRRLAKFLSFTNFSWITTKNNEIMSKIHLIIAIKRIATFIPGIWTHSTAVPVAFERNSAKVSSAMDKSLENIKEQIPLARIFYQTRTTRTWKFKGQAKKRPTRRSNLLTLQGWHPLVDAEESNGADHWSPPIHNLYPWWQGSPAMQEGKN